VGAHQCDAGLSSGQVSVRPPKNKQDARPPSPRPASLPPRFPQEDTNNSKKHKVLGKLGIHSRARAESKNKLSSPCSPPSCASVGVSVRKAVRPRTELNIEERDSMFQGLSWRGRERLSVCKVREPRVTINTFAFSREVRPMRLELCGFGVWES
jgi:hypothetical protein